ncbi:MAG: ATP-grasp domain-containing protein [Anaerolineae bacterium]|nr:ATP-grasp domain-containing protein [Thermoflexales bacterium]MDW8406223.1 ATP-grasp domain-containing protein [Anaerolineae bacterium]
MSINPSFTVHVNGAQPRAAARSVASTLSASEEEATAADPAQRARPLRVALLVSIDRNAPPVPADAPYDILAELDSEKTAYSYAQALLSRGYEVQAHEGNVHLPEWLGVYRPDICYNVCEGFTGESREAQVPAMLEMMGLRYTGPGPLAAAITQDKPTTQRILHYYGIPIPLFQVFESPDDPPRPDFVYPLFVKPAHEGTGMGIRNTSIVRNERQLREQVAWTIASYRQPALVETYIEGKDITCGLVGNGNDVHFFPITEVDFSGYPPELEPIYGVQQKVDYADYYRNKCPAPLGEKLTAEVRRLTHQVFKVTGCRDYGRVDFRLTDDGRLYVLEINSLPGITPHSDLTLMAQAEGWTHADLVCAVLDAALKRYSMTVETPSGILRAI